MSLSAFLCLRRGVSAANSAKAAASSFSLPTQRCFCVRKSSEKDAGLFSAYAEVFPCDTSRAERAFSFLCLRRGVSGLLIRCHYSVHFSLPTQRCFQGTEIAAAPVSLFSAYAEVFLYAGFCLRVCFAFLCLRRGVSLTRHLSGQG